MAEVVSVERETPKVKGFTLKVSVSEARDLLFYINEHYRRAYGTSPRAAQGDPVFQAIEKGVKGVSRSDEIFGKVFNGYAGRI